MVRTIKGQMDQKLERWRNEGDGDGDVEVSGAVLTWLITHSANLITRYKVSQDGRTAYHRLKGKRCSHLVLPFGEKVLYKPLKKGGENMNKMEPRHEYGAYLGTSDRTGEVYIGTAEGVVKSRTVKRLIDSEQWDLNLLKSIVGTPWAPIDGEKEQDVPIRIPQRVIPADVEVPADPADRLPPVRRFRIYPKDVQDHGASDGCWGCKAVVWKRAPQAH
eukprot:12243523-Karenia_brevis.AAC.1